MKGTSEWLSTLNEGDEVCYCSGRHSYRIVKIDKITPSRQIKTDDGQTWRNGANGSGWGAAYLEPVTEGIRTTIWREAAIKQISKADFRMLDNSQISVIQNMFADKAEVS